MLTKIVCTGISGTRVGELISELAENHPGRIIHFDVGEEMLKIAKERGQGLDPVKILNRPTPMLDSFRTAALERAQRRVLEEEKGEDDRVFIIDTHSVFPWKRSLIPALDAYFLRIIQPDLYLTVVDNIAEVATNLWKNPQWNWLELDEILLWRDQELLLTEVISRATATVDGRAMTKHYLVPRAISKTSLSALILTPRRKTVYLSYPISHVPAELVKDAEEFGHELDAGLIVFNPLAIEDMKLVYALRDVLSASFPHDGARYTLDEHIMAIANRMNDSLKTNKISQQQVVRVIEHLSHQTVARDYRLIAQSDMVIVLYNPTALVVKDPETGDDTDVQKAFLSAGVICEMVFGTANDKDVYAVWPLEEEPSPFFAYNSTKVFKTKEDVVLYLRGAGLM